MKFLVDHNIEGQADILWGTLASEGWLELLGLKLFRFVDVGLHFESNDRIVWRFVQSNKMILLTDNRNMDDEDSLEQTIRDENTLISLPILTIGNVGRLDEKLYRIECATRIAEIVIDLEKLPGFRSNLYSIENKQASQHQTLGLLKKI